MTLLDSPARVATFACRRSEHDIIELYRRRMSTKPFQRENKELRDLLGGGIVIPIPELDMAVKAAVANLARQGLEQLAMRSASTMPQTAFMVDHGRNPDTAKERARSKRDAVRSWWDDNRMAKKLHKRSLHIWGYASSPVVLRPDFKRGIPAWQVRDPLAAYPAARWDEEDPTPEDCIFGLEFPYATLRARYPEQAALLDSLEKGGAWDLSQPYRDRNITVLEYVDAEQLTFIALAGQGLQAGLRGHCVLERWPNRAERPLVVMPELISIDMARSPFADMPAMHHTQAYLQALNLLAVKEGIRPQEWLVATGPAEPQILHYAQPEKGIPGVVKDGDLKVMNLNPGYKTDVVLPQLERAMRVEAGIPAEFGGESSSTVKTARRGDQILSAAVDFRIQKVQTILADSLQAEDCAAIAIDKAWWGNDKKSFYFTSKDKITSADYIPAKLWDSDRHIVKYSLSGTDVNTLGIAVGGLLGTGLAAKAEMRAIHPLIEDAERAADEIRGEQVEDAAMQGWLQMVVQGQVHPDDLALFTRLVVNQNVPIYEALEKVQASAQKRQEAEAEEALPPEQMQPGLGGGLAPAPAVPEPAPGISNVANLVSRLNRPRQVAESLGRVG